jgi:hypothetical protein
MAWTAPMTAATNATFTSAQFNANVRDNLLQTLPALATGSTNGWFVATGANQLIRRTMAYSTVSTLESTTSTTYTNLATSGPAVTVTTGTQALVIYSGEFQHDTANGAAYMSYAVSGATTIAASDTVSINLDGIVGTKNNSRQDAHLVTLTAGSNTFTAKYRAGSSTSNFQKRRITVIPFS